MIAMTRRLLVLPVLLIAACLAGCPGPTTPPAPDVCDTPVDGAGVATIEIGPNEDTFRPFAQNEAVALVQGGQGGSMLPLRLRLTGTSVPECIAQATSVSYDMQTLASDSAPLRTYAESDGSRTTKALFVVLDFGPQSGSTVVVTVSVGGQMTALPLSIE